MIEIGGLPAHILLIHAVVVLAPMAGVLSVVFALVARSRRLLAWPLGILALVMVPLSVLTAEAGEQLEKAMRVSPLLREHAEQGSFFRFVTAIFLVVVAAQIVTALPSAVPRWGLPHGLHRALRARWLVPLTSVLGVLAGLFLISESVLNGHSGSASVWSGI
jgi:hypothetical protein